MNQLWKVIAEGQLGCIHYGETLSSTEEYAELNFKQNLKDLQVLSSQREDNIIVAPLYLTAGYGPIGHTRNTPITYNCGGGVERWAFYNTS